MLTAFDFGVFELQKRQSPRISLTLLLNQKSRGANNAIHEPNQSYQEPGRRTRIYLTYYLSSFLALRAYVWVTTPDFAVGERDRRSERTDTWGRLRLPAVFHDRLTPTNTQLRTAGSGPTQVKLSSHFPPGRDRQGFQTDLPPPSTHRYARRLLKFPFPRA